jgi:hypothetical protein
MFCFETSSLTIRITARWNSSSSHVESVMKLFIEAWFLYSTNDLFMDETFILSGRTIRPARYLIAFSTCLQLAKADCRYPFDSLTKEGYSVIGA